MSRKHQDNIKEMSRKALHYQRLITYSPGKERTLREELVYFLHFFKKYGSVF